MFKRVVEANIIELSVDVESEISLTDLIKELKSIRNTSSQSKWKYCIHCASTIGEFQTELGKVVYGNSGLGIHIPIEFTEETDSMMYILIGRMVLDTYLVDTYWMKSDAEKKVYEIRGDN